MAQYDAMGLDARATQRNGKAMLPGKFPSLGDGTNQEQTKSVELEWCQDQDVALALLFAAPRRIEIDVENVASFRNTALQSNSF